MKVLGLVLSFFVLVSNLAMAEVEVYTVQKGDALEKIAKEKLDDAALWVQLAKYNDISNPDLIRIGQKILIPPESELILKSREKGSLETRLKELEGRLSLYGRGLIPFLLEDTFEDDKLAKKPEGWSFPSGGRWGISRFGSRILEQADRRAPNSAALIGENGWSDYIVQVELRIEHSGDAGVFAYWNSHLGNYRLRTGGTRSSLEIAKRVPRGPKRYDTIALNRTSFRLEDSRWYIFKFEVTTHDSYTYLKGKVWRKGETEPGTWLLEASDHSSERYKSGLAGVWTQSMGTSYRGAKFDNFRILDAEY